MGKISSKVKAVLLWLESLLIPMFILGFLIVKCGVYFEMNDDRVINEIFTGVLTGTPDGHAVFVNYILGAFFSFCYSINGEIPWYGGFLVLGHLMVYWSFFGLILERCKNWYEHILGIVIGCFFVLANLYIFGEIQYTSTAILLAACGYLWLLFDESKYRRYILFFVFELFAYLLRSMSMLMVQPIGGVLFGITLLIALKKEGMSGLKGQVKKGLVVVCILLSCLGIAWIGNYVWGDYGSVEWKEYTYFRELRGEMADYYNFPDYEKVSTILDEYQVSENEYIAFTRYWMLGNEIDNECLKKLYEVAERDYLAGRGSVTEILKALVGSRFQGGIMGYGKYTLVLYAFVGALILAGKKWDMLFSLIGLNLSRNATLGYIIYRGRFPFRVISGLYFIEILFLMAWLFVLLKDIRKERMWIRVAAFVVSLAATVIFVDTVRETYRGLYWTNQGRLNYACGMNELVEYCTESDYGYVCVEMATSYYTGDVFDMSWYRDRNYLSSGFWWSKSPNIESYQKDYIKKNNGKMRLIEVSQGMDPGRSYATELFTVDWGVELIFVEQLVLSNGLSLDVYDIKGDIEY